MDNQATHEKLSGRLDHSLVLGLITDEESERPLACRTPLKSLK
jgi:hypothetical protein